MSRTLSVLLVVLLLSVLIGVAVIIRSVRPSPGRPASFGCKIGGCSGELCLEASAKDEVSTCFYRDNWACYKRAACERQVTGRCGWTLSDELKTCLASKQPPSPAPSSSGPTLLSPQPGNTLTGPLVIRGSVPKSWTFEGQFLMKLLDNNRRLIIQDRVPVEWDNANQKVLLNFAASYNYHTSADSGFLVLENDNPSGLPENQKSYEIPVNFLLPSAGIVYIFDQASGQSEIDNQCQVVLPRPVNLSSSKTLIKDTLGLLAKSMHPDFYIKSLVLKDGLLTVEFPSLPGFTTGGSCAQGINYLKVTKTALQFPEVRQVKITPDSIFQP